MELPGSEGLDVSRLARVFADKTNAYKFYWFLAILDSLKENGQSQISTRDLSLRMIAQVWYPLNYFKLSFGKQDTFKAISEYISERIDIDNSTNSRPLFEQLQNQLSVSELAKVYKMVDGKTRYVPYRFVRPFLAELIVVDDIGDNVKNAIIYFSNSLFDSNPERVMYRFLGDSIEINDVWKAYLQKHQYILRGFIFWHLVQFLQRNNPNVIGLSEKLEKPSVRVLTTANKFWRGYLNEKPGLQCVYSGQIITTANLSLDHFLPWSFVAHDQLWNIIPTTRSVNSAKGDKLPSLDLYFDGFVQMQFNGFHFQVNNGRDRLLEDYTILFRQSLNAIQQQPLAWFRERLEQTVFPQLQTAKNLGFCHPFIYP